MMLAKFTNQVRYAAHIVTAATVLACLALPMSTSAVQVTLMWDASPESDIQSYNVYYGQGSRSYSTVVNVSSNRTSATLTNLTAGNTYYFAVTSKNVAGLESDYSTELNYTVPGVIAPGNTKPTLDALSNVTVDEDSGTYQISLSGISSGSTGEVQTLTVTAFSGNTALLPNPTITYTSPKPTGVLSMQPKPNASGTTVVTVMVDDGGTNNNTVIQTFTVTVRPLNDPPTLNALTNLSLKANPGKQTVTLAGISTGSTNESETLLVTATSSNPGLTGTPVVNYTSPNPTGTLEFTPVTNATGIARITVTVNDQQAVSNTVSRDFEVLVAQTVSTNLTMTNAIVAPYALFRWVIPSPFANNHRVGYVLDANAPEGAKIASKKNSTWLSWTPTSSYASTTNLITVRVNDLDSPGTYTNYVVQVAVLDYLTVLPGVAAAESGKTAQLPVYAHCSDGLTNLTFSLTWPGSRFGTPTFTVATPSLFTATLQNQTTNILVRLRAQTGQTFNGSNLIGHVTFPVPAAHGSEFVALNSRQISGNKPGGGPYVSLYNQAGEVVVVKDAPLMRSTYSTNNGRILNLYGKVGVSYELQSATGDMKNPTWAPLTTYAHTNVSQTLSVSSSAPMIFYRLLQK